MPPHRRNVNTVFQSYALFPFLSVFDNVAFGLRHGHVAKADLRKRVGDALALVSLSAFASRRPGQLSGGQQQRVALARLRRPNRVPALVERVVYLGAATQVHLRLATGESLQAEIPNEGADAVSLAQGTPVHAYLPADALRVLSGSPAAAPVAAEPLAS